ncbi:DUF4360 domain-containing protein [Nannocystis pusilla]|uniref:DUF4360 domain-containing protein n=1 Tax=Nannocystis pusilla TaxID=889268 RepID=A0ABS7U357_9BACT|nr:DUF4360 domain-containing protein [Nannocystis pusilla]MBZ5714874.1 DUF4360 domain-containing protein [Nannocystis pusilla]
MLILDTLAKFPAYLVGLLGSLAPPGGPSGLDAPPAGEVVASEPEPDPDTMYIEEVVAEGTGCDDEDKYSVVIDSDKNSFMIIYNDMKLTNLPTDENHLKSKNCLVSVRLHIPGGLQIAMASVVSRGSATLAEKVTARATSRYWYAGDPVGSRDGLRFTGPHDDVFDYHRDVPLHSLVWSPCGEPAVFALDNLLSLNATKNPEEESEIMLVDTDVGFSQLVRWKIQECD